MMILRSILFVGIGGGIGCVLRYLVGVVVGRYFQASWPQATFVVNMAGCLLIGMLVGWLGRQGTNAAELRSLLVTGFCGGFTTYSAFALENVQLLQSGHAGLVAAYVAASIIGGILLVCAGMWMMR